MMVSNVRFYCMEQEDQSELHICEMGQKVRNELYIREAER